MTGNHAQIVLDCHDLVQPYVPCSTLGLSLKSQTRSTLQRIVDCEIFSPSPVLIRKIFENH